jgi:TRAP-type C4-dicarboxylate transport system permease small subunit
MSNQNGDTQNMETRGQEFERIGFTVVVITVGFLVASGVSEAAQAFVNMFTRECDKLTRSLIYMVFAIILTLFIIYFTVNLFPSLTSIRQDEGNDNNGDDIPDVDFAVDDILAEVF